MALSNKQLAKILPFVVDVNQRETAMLTKAVLRQFDLEGLTNWAVSMVQQGVSEAEFALRLRETSEFKSRFWMIFEREKKGLPPLAPEEVVAYERQAGELANQYGIPLTRRMMGEAMAADVSATELNQRFQIAALAVHQSPAETREELERLYGVSQGELALFWMQPKRQLPELQRKFAAAELSGVARRTGFGTALSRAQAERLGEAGLTAEEAEQGFGALASQRELFQRTYAGEDEVDVETQLEALIGDVEAQEEIEERGERRVARFQEGGQFATGQEGVRGVGSAAR